jgi:hypothetical protein
MIFFKSGAWFRAAVRPRWNSAKKPAPLGRAVPGAASRPRPAARTPATRYANFAGPARPALHKAAQPVLITPGFAPNGGMSPDVTADYYGNNGENGAPSIA